MAQPLPVLTDTSPQLVHHVTAGSSQGDYGKTAGMFGVLGKKGGLRDKRKQSISPDSFIDSYPPVRNVWYSCKKELIARLLRGRAGGGGGGGG